ncbi:MAG: hypothetical protein DMF68_13770 [Acidobacteria bacterium]|nr:MAG: hypothetical protein DMF68_13770 [Acidobacteriota bacterium]
MNYLKLLSICTLAFLFAGCSVIAKKEDSGRVIARRAQVRSSTAVVAADLVEVTRGDTVDILDSEIVEGEKWLLVRAHDLQSTEGWIEARYIMPQDVLDKARKLADEDKDIPPQASGQLRASSNLRLSPDYTSNDNILMKLESGSSFEIIGWKRVPKPKGAEKKESDDAPKAGSVQTTNKAQKESDADQEPEETTDLWYKVRLPTSVSPAPAGWIYAKQVELTVPSDIIFYRGGSEFVGWHRLDEEAGANATNAPKDKDAAKEMKPGSWVILEKSNTDEPHKLDEPDFDQIYVLGYDKYRQEHYTAYLSPELKGYLPLRLEGTGDNKTFTVRIQGDDGQIKDARYSISRDDRGVLKVTPPETQRKRR